MGVYGKVENLSFGYTLYLHKKINVAIIIIIMIEYSYI